MARNLTVRDSEEWAGAIITYLEAIGIPYDRRKQWVIAISHHLRVRSREQITRFSIVSGCIGDYSCGAGETGFSS
jgi:hypothetical protein